jgi:hypothetical protein
VLAIDASVRHIGPATRALPEITAALRDGLVEPIGHNVEVVIDVLGDTHSI